MIEHSKNGISVRKQCELMDINRSRVYYKKKPCEDLDEKIMHKMIEINEELPFYGYRRMKVELNNLGYRVNSKKVKHLMKKLGIQALYPKKKTTMPNSSHKKYPYLLRNTVIDRPDKAWGVDITYIKIKSGYAYLAGLIDIFSRKIVGWSLSPFLDVQPSIEAFQDALKKGKPEIVNSDQGCQYTSNEWILTIEKEGAKVSMDGKGRWVDNVFIERFWRSIKYESVYLHSFETIPEAREILGKYIEFYNRRRPHQALGYKTPDFLYFNRKKFEEDDKNLTKKDEPILVLSKGGVINSQKPITFWS